MKIRILTFLAIVAVVTAFLFLMSHRWPVDKPHKTSGAKKALDSWAAARAYPNELIPEQGYYEAFNYSRQFMNISRERDTRSTWEPIGPHNIGGRTIAIAFNPQNPNTIYAGSASGGLWRSYSGGVGSDVWEAVPTGFPVLGVGGIAIAPDDSNTIYIGTGEVYGYQNAIGGLSNRTTRGSYGIGILKTTDGGETWVKSLDWTYNQLRGVWTIKIDPNNYNFVWAATTEGVYKSTDAGETWELKHPVIMAFDLAINSYDSDIVFASHGNFYSEGHGIYRTDDGGENWLKLSNGLPETFGGKVLLSIYPPMPYMIYASIGNGFSGGAGTWLCFSAVNGENWQIVSTVDYATFQGWFAHFVAVSPVDSSLVICGGVDLYKSTDFGADLQQKSYWDAGYSGVVQPGEPEGPPYFSHADHHAVAFHPTDPNIVYFGNDGGVFRSTDAGETFEGCNGGYQSSQFYNGFSCSYQDSLLAIGGMQDNGSATYEGTVAWRRVLGGDGCWTGIDAGNDNILYASYQVLGMRKSTNSGQSWLNINPPGAGFTNFIAPYVVAVDNPQVIYAGRSIIYKSDNGGIDWTGTNNSLPLDGRPALSMAVSASNSEVVYVSTTPVPSQPNIFRTTNGGQDWDNVTGENMPDRYPMDFAIDPSDDSNVYLVFSGFGSSHIFKTIDGGENWLDINNNLPDLPTSAVIVDPLYADHVYVGNDLGVFVSTDGGDVWEPFFEEMPEAAIVMDLTISHSNRKLRAVTHGNGVYERPLLEESVSVEVGEQAASAFGLEQNYPNPWSPDPAKGLPRTTIAYSLGQPEIVTVKIYNSAGQEVRTLVDRERQAQGKQQIVWDGKNNRGEEVVSGTYLYRLEAGDFSAVKKMSLLK